MDHSYLSICMLRLVILICFNLNQRLKPWFEICSGFGNILIQIPKKDLVFFHDSGFRIYKLEC